jgi:hypothetical protein
VDVRYLQGQGRTTAVPTYFFENTRTGMTLTFDVAYTGEGELRTYVTRMELEVRRDDRRGIDRDRLRAIPLGGLMQPAASGRRAAGPEWVEFQ